MKSLFAIGMAATLALLLVAPAAAQFGRGGAIGSGISARGITRPLGGFSPGFGALGTNRSSRVTTPRRIPYGYPYAYSVWVPDYFDYLDYQNQPYAYAAPSALPPGATGAPESQQPVIINQYFSGSAPQQANPPANSSNTQAPGDVIGTPQNYYLIAYKNHAVYPAIAYWLEDRTLHYVTTQNTHNQASLNLIDLTLTKSLNQNRDVPFSIAGQ